MTTIFYILIAFCLLFEVLNLAACKKVFAAVEKYKDKNDLTEISPVSLFGKCATGSTLYCAL